MAAFSYRLNSPVTVEIEDRGRYRLKELPSGSKLVCCDFQPDRNRMIGATCEGMSVLIFLRDLEYDAERIEM